MDPVVLPPVSTMVDPEVLTPGDASPNEWDPLLLEVFNQAQAELADRQAQRQARAAAEREARNAAAIEAFLAAQKQAKDAAKAAEDAAKAAKDAAKAAEDAARHSEALKARLSPAQVAHLNALRLAACLAKEEEQRAKAKKQRVEEEERRAKAREKLFDSGVLMECLPTKPPKIGCKRGRGSRTTRAPEPEPEPEPEPKPKRNKC